jgi:hypothetical protein
MRRRIALGLLAFCTACSLLVGFDPDGQPCDPSGACLEGYTCLDGKCRKGTSGCTTCEPGFRCQNNTCVPASCAVQLCPVGYTCADDAGFPVCRGIAEPSLGHSCRSDLECQKYGENRFCFLGAIPLRSGGLRPGVCFEACVPGDGGPASDPDNQSPRCDTAGTSCQTFFFGRDSGGTRVCLPPDLVRGCRVDGECFGEAPSCTVFDHPLKGPLGLCDKPLASAPGSPTAGKGEACSLQVDAGALCANGLCVPPGAVSGRTSHCGELCDTLTCPTNSLCTLAEVRIQSSVRHVPLCVASPSTCRPCAADSVCTEDAPWCSTLPDSGTLNCLASCSPGNGASLCPPGTACQTILAGPRCVPLGGSCP